VVKADLTGAKVKVVNSKNPTTIGVEGIVTRESVRALFLINEKDEVKCIVKAGQVFEVSLPATHGGGDYAIRIWGDNITYLGSERTKVRFKEKFALDLY
jgi:RNase P/RNase MRP subunit p29